MSKLWYFLLGAACGFVACSPSEPQTGSQTNWIRSCEASADCGVLSCICNTCTRPCDDDTGCSDLEGASCVPAAEEGAVATCGGERYPSAGLCLQRCDRESCGDGAACVAGVCSTSADSTVEVTVDLGTRFQTLVGFGASLAYVEDEIVAHPMKSALFDLMFEDSGIDVVRLRNRFDGSNQGDLAAASEILSAAAERLGRSPTTVLTEGSPPAGLKASGSRVCAGNADTCTLVRLSDGEFDYVGFAEHWRASLEAHAEAGIALDYLSVQNNPNWVPPESAPADACRFLPVEGTAVVSVSGAEVEVTYPGFAEALTAVLEAIFDLPAAPKIAAPEVSEIGSLSEYVAALDLTDVDALAHHLYGTDPMAVDEDALREVGALARASERPVFQTEMRADALGTAILMQSALTAGAASTYLQNDFVASASVDGGDPWALISLQAESFRAEGTFHTMRHFARFTDPGWVRVDAAADAADVLASAWLSPDEDALSVVLVNAGTTEQSVVLDLGADAVFDGSEVIRTTFDGLERSVVLGALSALGVVQLPAHAIVTIALER